jgi:hypothetical protein
MILLTHILCLTRYSITHRILARFKKSGNSRFYCMRFQAVTAATMTLKAFWDIAPCSLVTVDRRFRDA